MNIPDSSLATFMFLHFLYTAVLPGTARSSTQLQALSNDPKIAEIQEKWSEIRLMDREEAQKTLEGEWLEAYNRFYEKYDDDMTRMTEIAEKVQKMIEPPKVQKKTKGQKRRDAYAKVVAREQARAAAA
jgi:hypothetical protein